MPAERPATAALCSLRLLNWPLRGCALDVPPQASDSSSDAATTIVTVMVNATSGALMELSVGLAGDWTVARVAQRLGCSWPAGWDAAATISNPTITVTTAAGGACTGCLPYPMLLAVQAHKVLLPAGH